MLRHLKQKYSVVFPHFFLMHFIIDTCGICPDPLIQKPRDAFSGKDDNSERYEMTEELLERFFQKDSKLLELGAGNGRFEVALNSRLILLL